MARGYLITIGSFDGVHLGHQELLKRTVLEAKKRSLKSLALTFNVPPRMILDKNSDRSLLSDPLEKRFLIRAQGIDEVVCLDFGRQFAKLRPFSFFRDVLLNRYRAKGLVVGSDFRFGENRSAGALELVRWGGEFNVPVWVISPVRRSGTVVSSTAIRRLMEQSRYRKAVNFLGHPYLIEGRVVKGQGLGKKMGFPTANLSTHPDKALPRGVYIVRGWTGAGLPKSFLQGVCNIGRRPTVSRKSTIGVEAHFFNRTADFRGRLLFLELLKKLRSEKKFSSVRELRAAIARDVALGRAFWLK